MTSTTPKSIGKACPYLKAPFADCACSKISSSTVESALEFCLGSFRKCSVFQAAMAKESRMASEATAGC